MTAFFVVVCLGLIVWGIDRWDRRRIERDEAEDRALRQMLEGRWR